MDALTGGSSNRGAELAAKQAAANQRKSLAQLAAQQAEADQAAADPSGGKKRGSRLLTFLSGSGQETLG